MRFRLAWSNLLPDRRVAWSRTSSTESHRIQIVCSHIQEEVHSIVGFWSRTYACDHWKSASTKVLLGPRYQHGVWRRDKAKLAKKQIVETISELKSHTLLTETWERILWWILDNRERSDGHTRGARMHMASGCQYPALGLDDWFYPHGGFLTE